MDNAIHLINLYQLDSVIGFPNIYPLDSAIKRLSKPGLDEEKRSRDQFLVEKNEGIEPGSTGPKVEVLTARPPHPH